MFFRQRFSIKLFSLSPDVSVMRIQPRTTNSVHELLLFQPQMCENSLTDKNKNRIFCCQNVSCINWWPPFGKILLFRLVLELCPVPSVCIQSHNGLLIEIQTGRQLERTPDKFKQTCTLHPTPLVSYPWQNMCVGRLFGLISAALTAGKLGENYGTLTYPLGT